MISTIGVNWSQACSHYQAYCYWAGLFVNYPFHGFLYRSFQLGTNSALWDCCGSEWVRPWLDCITTFKYCLVRAGQCFGKTAHGSFSFSIPSRSCQYLSSLKCVFLQFCVLAVQIFAMSCGVVQHFEKTQICADPVMSICHHMAVINSTEQAAATGLWSL